MLSEYEKRSKFDVSIDRDTVIYQHLQKLVMLEVGVREYKKVVSSLFEFLSNQPEFQRFSASKNPRYADAFTWAILFFHREKKPAIEQFQDFRYQKKSGLYKRFSKWLLSKMWYRTKDPEPWRGKPKNIFIDSLDKPVGKDETSQATLADFIPSSSLSLLEEMIETLQKEADQSWWVRFVEYVNTDPENLLRDCYTVYPGCNAQVVTQLMYLSSVDPPLRQYQIEAQFNINRSTLSSFMNQRYILLLKQIIRQINSEIMEN
jgi:hypothetical protein